MAFDRSPRPCWRQTQWLRKASGLAAALLLLFSASAAAFPQAFAVRYEVTYSGLTLGEAHVDYRQIGADRYRYSSHIRPLGLAAMLLRSEITELSEGRIVDSGFRPHRYEYRRTGRNSRETDLIFDWEQRKVINNAADAVWKERIPDDVLDRMVSQLQLMHDLAVAEEDLSYPIADGNRIKRYTLRIVGQEIVRTPYGDFETLKIIRVADSDKRSTTFWCAPALNYLPVRVEHQEKGDNFTMHLRDLEGLSPKAPSDPQLTKLQAQR